MPTRRGLDHPLGAMASDAGSPVLRLAFRYRIISALQDSLDETERRISRLVEALAASAEDLPGVRAALTTLERERAAGVLVFLWGPLRGRWATRSGGNRVP